jgi:hypothetical protein
VHSKAAAQVLNFWQAAGDPKQPLLTTQVSSLFAANHVGVASFCRSNILSNKRSAPDGLKFAKYLWHTEHDARYARSVLDDLLDSHPDSEEATAASSLLEEISNGAVSINATNIDAAAKGRATRHVTAALLVASGIGLIFFGKSIMYSGPIGDGGIYGLFGVLSIAAGGLLAVITAITWFFGTLAQLFGGKRLLGWLCILLAVAVILSIVAPVIGLS